jgi:hypothetical protein
MTSLKKSLLAALAALFPLPLFATVQAPIDSKMLLNVIFSSIHQNRISVEGGTVKKVLYQDCDVYVSIEETSNQVFVYSLTDRPPMTTLSLILEDGTVQDIEIDFQHRRSELLILSNIKEPPCKTNYIDDTWDGVARLIRGVCLGKIPPTYLSCEFPQAKKNLGKGLFARLSGKLLADRELVYLWEIENAGCSTASLSEGDFSSRSVNWVYLHKNRLSRNQKTFAIVSVAR